MIKGQNVDVKYSSKGVETLL